MVDVDHFKKFNDTHGHDIGDQVLKLVGARLAEVGGGGVAYRYGGEEFSVLFPAQRPRARRCRTSRRCARSIEGYRMAVRGEDRPKNAEDGAKLRSDGQDDAAEVLSVTVSHRRRRARRQARCARRRRSSRRADEALYRASRAAGTR